MGCSSSNGGDPEPETDPSFTVAPVITQAGPAPLARLLSFETDRPCDLEILLDNGSDHQVRIAYDDYISDREATILGMHPGETYDVTINVRDEDERSTTWTDALSITTDPAPEAFPIITVNLANVDDMEPGYTVLDAFSQNLMSPVSYVIIVDAEGNVVWYLSKPIGTSTDRLPNGNLLILSQGGPDRKIEEVDMHGNTVIGFHATGTSDGPSEDSIAVDTENFHHDVLKIDGVEPHYVTSTRVEEYVENFPTSELDSNSTGMVLVADEPVIEFSAAGEIVGQWNFLDLLKPTRIGYEGSEPSILDPTEAADWVHFNSVWLDTSDNSFIVSLRHQDAVVKFSRTFPEENAEVIWILGTHHNWEGFEDKLLTPLDANGTPLEDPNQPMFPDFMWSYHTHAAMLTPSGTVMLFDNGNRRASPFTGEVPILGSDNCSRAVEYEVDEEEMTVSQVWQYGCSLSSGFERIFASAVGDVDVLPIKNNVLINFGILCESNGEYVDPSEAFPCPTSARILEVKHDDSETKVFDLEVQGQGQAGYIVYRAERLPTLYPDDSVALSEPDA